MSSEAELGLGESEADTRERRRLQQKWWKRLAEHPEATLHRHITPGNSIMFGISNDDRECLIAPGLSLIYFVWRDRCEASLHIDDTSDPQPEYPLKMRPQNDWERSAYKGLLANKEQIEASFGEKLDWHESGIGYYCDGGYINPEQEWDEIIYRQVSTMNRLHAALLPHVGRVPSKEGGPTTGA